MAVKLTAQQILEIIEENYSEEAFAYNDWFDTDNVEVSEGIGEKEQEEKDAFWKTIQSLMIQIVHQYIKCLLFWKNRDW